MTTQESEDLFGVLLFGGVLLAWVLYMVPTIIAFRRRHPDRWLITVANLLLGATGIGWIVALVWALRLELPTGVGVPMLAYAGSPSEMAQSPSISWGAPDHPHALASPLLTPGAAVAEIERLSALLTAGHLSDAEFADLKGDVLRRLQAGARA